MKLSDRVSIAAALSAAGFSALVAGRLLAPKEPLSAPEPVDPSDYFSAEEIAAGRSFSRPQARLGMTASAIEFAALGMTAWQLSHRSVPAHRIPQRRLAHPHRPDPVAQALGAAGAGAGLTIATTLITLPFSVASRRRSLAVGLATDAWSSWAVDLAKSSLIEATLTSALLAGSSALASRTKGRWWLYASAGIIGVGLIAVTLGPVVMEPVFNTFDPLPEGETRDDVLALANAAGVNVGEVYSVDASRRSTAVNAYVNGLGPTKRVVLFDTLLSDYGRDEVRFVVAHELGHVHHRDVPRQLVFMALCAPSMTFAIQRLAEAWAGGLTGARAVPALALASSVAAAPLVLAAAALSRAVEARTDQFGLTLSDAPEGLVSFFRGIAVQNRADVTPARFVRRWLATHPPITGRIGAALTYERATAARRRRTPAGS